MLAKPLILLIGIQVGLVLCSFDLFDCGVVLRKSTVVDGIGVFAAREYREGDVVERSITPIYINNDISKLSSLINSYVFGHLEDEISYHNVVLGNAMVYNHHSDSNVLIAASASSSPRLGDYGNMSHYVRDFVVYAKRDIAIGKE